VLGDRGGHRLQLRTQRLHLRQCRRGVDIDSDIDRPAVLSLDERQPDRHAVGELIEVWDDIDFHPTGAGDVDVRPDVDRVRPSVRLRAVHGITDLTVKPGGVRENGDLHAADVGYIDFRLQFERVSGGVVLCGTELALDRPAEFVGLANDRQICDTELDRFRIRHYATTFQPRNLFMSAMDDGASPMRSGCAMPGRGIGFGIPRLRRADSVFAHTSQCKESATSASSSSFSCQGESLPRNARASAESGPALATIAWRPSQLKSSTSHRSRSRRPRSIRSDLMA